MTLARAVLLAIVLTLISCTETPPEFRVCSDYTYEEWAATWDVYEALGSLGYEPTGCVYFIHDVTEHIPALGCAWVDFRIRDIDPSHPGMGYMGAYVPDRGTFISQAPGNEAHLVGLLIHELAHNVGFVHGERMREFETEVRRALR